MDDYERIIAVGTRGIYESNYLKANSPDGRRGLWLKHNLLRPLDGEGYAELWAVLYERGAPPIVAKREVPWSEIEAASDRVALRAGSVRLDGDRAVGQIADVSWSLALSGGNPPLFLLPYAWMYTGGFPKKKGLTPRPNLRFDGEVSVGGQRWPIDGWVGLRGHNWGTEHAHAYAYGNCNLWDDGDPRRTVDGLTVRIKLGGRPTPWLTLVTGQSPDVRRSTPRNWLGSGEVRADRWEVAFGGLRRRPMSLEMSADPTSYAGLRYAHPDGRESYCYNTKFADVRYTVGGHTHTSRCGELEVLFPEPLADIPLHPTAGWAQADGDYRSSSGG